MWEKILQKNLYSEWVIRNTLYWMTSVSPWKLE
ncbi:His-Xaa-Ser system protein HxsD, partial [Cronobacter sakazakii]